MRELQAYCPKETEGATYEVMSRRAIIDHPNSAVDKDESYITIKFLDQKNRREVAAERWLVGQRGSYFCELIPEVDGYVPVEAQWFVDGEFPISPQSGLTVIVFYETNASFQARCLRSGVLDTLKEIGIGALIVLALIATFKINVWSFSGLIERWQDHSSSAWADQYAERISND